jgi:hypothetical protein
MVGAGPTFFGTNLKGGIFLKKHFLLGVSMEVFKKRGRVFPQKICKQQ